MADEVEASLRRAADAHRRGALDVAEIEYQAALRRAPRHGTALEGLGALLLQLNRPREAIPLIETAAAQRPTEPSTLINLAIAYRACGDFEAARRAIDRAIVQAPRSGQALVLKGELCLALRDYASAVAAYRAHIDIEPNNPISNFNLGVAHRELGQCAEAAAAFRRAVHLRPNLGAGWSSLADMHRELGEDDQALKCYRRAHELDPRDTVTLNNLGLLLTKRNHVPEALTCLNAALELCPGDPRILMNIGNCFRKIKNYEEAERIYREVIRIDERLYEAHSNLGDTVNHLGRWTEAIACYERAIAHGWSTGVGLQHIAITIADKDYLAAAISLYDTARVSAIGDNKLEYRQSLNELKAGRFITGWQRHETRLYDTDDKHETHKQRYASPPKYWEGESLDGKSLFLWTEGGLGDQILFASMLPDLLARGGRVTFDCKPRLLQVFERSFPKAKMITHGAVDSRVVNPEQYDLQIAIGSLGRFFRVGQESFPRHAGYLRADPDKVARYRAAYRELAGGRRIIGLSWRSKNEFLGASKSTQLEEWSDVLRCEGAWFVNLQYGDCAAALATVKKTLGVEVYQDPAVDALGDLDDFFAQVAAMDLVISTSNTAVHVAGSQNVPTWVVLPRGGGSLWYWFLDRCDSPWYPSLKLYRQETAATAASWWRDVMPRLGADLDAWVNSD